MRQISEGRKEGEKRKRKRKEKKKRNEKKEKKGKVAHLNHSLKWYTGDLIDHREEMLFAKNQTAFL